MHLAGRSPTPSCTVLQKSYNKMMYTLIPKPGPSQKKTEIPGHSDKQDNSRKEEYGEDKELTSRTDVLPRQSMVCASTPDSVPTEKKLGIPMSSNYMLRTESSSTRSVTVPEIMNEDTLNIPSPDPGPSEKEIRFGTPSNGDVVPLHDSWAKECQKNVEETSRREIMPGQSMPCVSTADETVARYDEENEKVTSIRDRTPRQSIPCVSTANETEAGYDGELVRKGRGKRELDSTTDTMPGQSQSPVGCLVIMKDAAADPFWKNISFDNRVPEEVLFIHEEALKTFVRPPSKRICSEKIVYDKPRGDEVSLLFKLLMRNLPLHRVRASDGQKPKTATDLKAEKFTQQQSGPFLQRLPKDASLSQLYEILHQFVHEKTRTSKSKLQMPKNNFDYEKCALKWDGFYLSEKEVKKICLKTVMQYYVCAQHRSSA